VNFANAQQALQEQTTQQDTQAMERLRGAGAAAGGGNGRMKERQFPT